MVDQLIFPLFPFRIFREPGEGAGTLPTQTFTWRARVPTTGAVSPKKTPVPTQTFTWRARVPTTGAVSPKKTPVPTQTFTWRAKMPITEVESPKKTLWERVGETVKPALETVSGALPHVASIAFWGITIFAIVSIVSSIFPILQILGAVIILLFMSTLVVQLVVSLSRAFRELF